MNDGREPEARGSRGRESTLPAVLVAFICLAPFWTSPVSDGARTVRPYVGEAGAALLGGFAVAAAVVCGLRYAREARRPIRSDLLVLGLAAGTILLAVLAIGHLLPLVL